jgi:hypothetical protein
LEIVTSFPSNLNYDVLRIPLSVEFVILSKSENAQRLNENFPLSVKLLLFSKFKTSETQKKIAQRMTENFIDLSNLKTWIRRVKTIPFCNSLSGMSKFRKSTAYEVK